MVGFLTDTKPVDANNTTFAGNSTDVNVMKPSDARKFAQALQGAIARAIADQGGTATLSGTNTYTATLAQAYTAYGTSAGQIINGTVLAIKPTAANTTAATVNFNTIGAKAIRLQGDSALVGGEMLANGIYLLRYDTAYNSAAGAWVLLNPASSTVSNATTSAPGIVQLATLAETTTGTNATKAVTPSDVPGLNNSAQGSLFGMTLSNDPGTPASVLDMAAGSCRDSTNVDTIAVATPYTKSLASTWTVGTGNGSLDIGTVGNNTYHVYAIKRVDTQVSDYLASLSNGTAATVTMTLASPCVVTWAGNGLQIGSQVVFSTTGALPTGVTAGTIYYVISAGFTAGTSFEFSATQGGSAINSSVSQSGVHTGTSNPQLPTNYTLFRRIGSIPRVSAALLLFVQDADYFTLGTPVSSVNVTNPGTSAVTRTLNTPVGVRTRARLLVEGFANGSSNVPGAIYISDLSVADAVASDPAPTTIYYSLNTTTAGGGGSSAEVYTDFQARVRSRVANSDGNTILRIGTNGWVDNRGRT